MFKKAVYFLFSVAFLYGLGIGDCLPQAQSEENPVIKLGEISFNVREMGSSSPFRVLEVQIEVYNRSLTATAPPNSVKVLVTPKEVTFSKQAPKTESLLGPQEVSIDTALVPSAGLKLFVGFSLPATKPKAITFDVQVNPPDGETKAVTWENSEE